MDGQPGNHNLTEVETPVSHGKADGILPSHGNSPFHLAPSPATVKELGSSGPCHGRDASVAIPLTPFLCPS